VIWAQLEHTHILPLRRLIYEKKHGATCYSIVSPWAFYRTIEDYIDRSDYQPAQDHYRFVSSS
jgi:hypothetical protein